MRPLTSLFSHDFPLIHVRQDETHFNPCLRQEQIHVKHLLFSALHLHLTNWNLIEHMIEFQKDDEGRLYARLTYALHFYFRLD